MYSYASARLLYLRHHYPEAFQATNSMIKCITKDCENHEHQGDGVMLLATNLPKEKIVWICLPCWVFLTTRQGVASHLCRNGIHEGLAKGQVVSVATLGKAVQAGYAEVMNQVEREREKCMREHTYTVTAQQKSPLAESATSG